LVVARLNPRFRPIQTESNQKRTKNCNQPQSTLILSRSKVGGSTSPRPFLFKLLDFVLHFVSRFKFTVCCRTKANCQQ